jgi:hypothetical protein
VALGLLIAEHGVDEDSAMRILADQSKVEDVSLLQHAQRLIAAHERSVSEQPRPRRVQRSVPGASPQAGRQQHADSEDHQSDQGQCE